MLSYIYDGLSETLEYTHIIIALITTYAIFYLWKVVHTPELISCNESFRSMLSENVTLLKQHYWPTFWAFTNHLQTTIRLLLHPQEDFIFKRIPLETVDKGETNLYFVHNDESKIYPDATTRPTVVIIPGICGDNTENYVKKVISECKEMGLRAVVFVNRGLGESTLKTPRTYCACNTEDLELALKHLSDNYPRSPLLFFAVSLGGCLLTHYLSSHGEELKHNIIGALAISIPWCSIGTTTSLEQPVNRFLYNAYLVKSLKSIITRNMKIFEEDENKQYDLAEIMKAQTMREFDSAFTCKIFGFESCDEYLTAASLANKPLENISVPILFLNAKDDPLAPFDSIPLEVIRRSPNIAVILTDYGGHIGFLEGMTISQRSLIEQLFFDYFSCLLQRNIDSVSRWVGI